MTPGRKENLKVASSSLFCAPLREIHLYLRSFVQKVAQPAKQATE